jgi:CubicO group peptidase (beta-lactamase class C family)
MKKLSFRAALVIVPIVLLLTAAAQPRDPQVQSAPEFAALDQVVLDELKQTNTPGAAVSIVRGEAVVLARGFGIANVETGEAVRPEMLFRLGSTTKMLTATALNTLVEDQRVKLDEPIGTYIKGMDAKLAQVTAHQLLTHTAGIRDEAPMFGLHDETALGARILSMDAGFLFATPGDVFSYANPGYWMAGYLAEVVAGKPYADVMQEKIFGPLGMERTTLRPTMAMTWPLAQGHGPGGPKGAAVVLRPAADNAAIWPSGSVFSNVNDLARFVIAFLNEGRLDGKQALPATVVRRLTTGYVDMPGGTDSRYGYGLEVQTIAGRRVWTHGGSRFGYGSFIAMVPDRKVGVIVLGNRTGSGLTRTTAKAVELAASLTAPPPSTDSAKPIPMSPSEMAELAGAYSQTLKPDVELFVRDGQLLMKFGANGLPVTKVAESRLAVQRPGGAPPQEFTVTRGKDGKTLYLHQGSRALRKIAGATR